LTGDTSGDAIAQSLSLHRRTLNRRLTEENTTFQFVLDQIRFDLACQLLAYSDISLDDVAASLAYAGVSPFMRSFHRLAGMSPGRWRRTFGARERKARVPSFRTRLDRAA
jgi:AraC-like DNA-binding protein